MTKPLIPNIDYYLNTDGNVVFTEAYHLKRGYCCQSDCLHCPYGFKDKVDPSIPPEFRDVWESDTYEIDDEDQDE